MEAAAAAGSASASASASDAAMLTTTTTVTASSTSSGGVANATTAAATSASSTTSTTTPSSSSPVMLRRKLPKAPVFVRRGPVARGHRALAAQNAQQQAQQLQADGAHQHLHAACTSPVSSERDLGGLQKRFEDEDEYHFSRLVASENRGRARAARARRRLHELDDALTNNEFERHARRHRDEEDEEEEEDYYGSNDHNLRVDLARAFTPVETCVPMRPPVASQITPTSPPPSHMCQALTHVDTDCEESTADAQEVGLENALTTVDTCAGDIGNATPPSPAGVWATASVPESSVTASAGADSATGGRDAFDLDIDGAEVVSEEETVDLTVAREAVEKRRSSSSPGAMAIAGVQEKEIIIRGPSSPSRSAMVEDDGDAENGKKKGKSPRRLRRGRKGKRETEAGNVKEVVNEENATATSAENSPRRRLRARLFRGRRRANGTANTKDKETEMKNANVNNAHSDDSDYESDGERARAAPSLPVNRNDARYSQTYAAARRVSLCDRFRLRRDRKRTQQLALVAPMVAENALNCSDGSSSENEDAEKRNSTAIQNAKEVAVITGDRAEKDVVQQYRQDGTPPAMVKGRRVRFACFQPKIKAELVTTSATSLVRNVSLAQDDWIDFATSAAIAQRQKKQWPFARKAAVVENQKAASPVKHRPPPPPILHPAGSHVVRWGGPS